MDSALNFGFVFVRLQMEWYSNVDLLKIGVSKDSMVEVYRSCHRLSKFEYR